MYSCRRPGALASPTTNLPKTTRQLIHLDGRVNLPREPEARVKADAPRQGREANREQRHVPEVQHISGQHGGLEVAEVDGRVGKYPSARGRRREEGTPPPVPAISLYRQAMGSLVWLVSCLVMYLPAAAFAVFRLAGCHSMRANVPTLFF